MKVIKSSHSHARAFTLIEAAISVVIIGVMLTSALSMTGASKLTRYRRALQDRAHMLADSLLTEILSLPYEDPEEATVTLGEDTNDAGVKAAIIAGDPSGLTIRRDWADDADDLDGWNQTPPINFDGSAMDGFTGWTRTISVKWVDPANLSVVSSSETGVKRIEVTASFGDQMTVTAVGIRSSAR